MSSRNKILPAACAFGLLCGGLMATAAAENIGQDQPKMRGTAHQVIEKPQLQGQSRYRQNARTYTAAIRINNPPCRPIRSAAPQPCVNSADIWSGWPQDLVEFFHE